MLQDSLPQNARSDWTVDQSWQQQSKYRHGQLGIYTRCLSSSNPSLSIQRYHHYTTTHNRQVPPQVRASVLAARTWAILILANDLIDRYFCSRLSGHHYFSIKWRLQAHMFDTAQTKSCHNDADLNNCNFCARDAAKSQIVVKIKFWADTIFFAKYLSKLSHICVQLI